MADDDQHNTDRRDVNASSGSPSSTPIHDDARPPLLDPSSTDTSLTRAANNDATNQSSPPPPRDASSSTTDTNDDDDDENPDADVDPHLANGHGKGGYGEHHEKQKTSNTENEQEGEEEDVIIVDWDGPDDPCNPRKCVLRSHSFVAVSNVFSIPSSLPHSLAVRSPMLCARPHLHPARPSIHHDLLPLLSLLSVLYARPATRPPTEC